MDNKVLVITSGEIGMRHQAQGLAAALSRDIDEQEVKLNWLRQKIPGHLLPYTGLKPPHISADTNIVISCGRRSTGFSIALKRSYPDLFTIHIQAPQIPLKHFDLVIPMVHDNCRGENTYSILSALHHITEDSLQREAQRFQKDCQRMPEKKIAMLLGGNTKDYCFSLDKLKRLHSAYQYFKREGYGVMLSTARRTPQRIIDHLTQWQNDDSDWFYLGGTSDNPYQCFLTEADGFLMTSDSVSMVSEVLFTGKPVYLFDLEGKSRRIEKFKQQLMDKGYVRQWGGQFLKYDYAPLDAKQDVASKVMELLANR